MGYFGNPRSVPLEKLDSLNNIHSESAEHAESQTAKKLFQNMHIMKNSVSTNHINIARHLRTFIKRDDGKKKQRLACTTA